MGEICHKMFTVDRVSLDSEIVFSINVFKEEPAMSVSVYLCRNIMLGFFSFLSCNSGNKLLPLESQMT